MDETDRITTECWKGAQQHRGQIFITVIKQVPGTLILSVSLDECCSLTKESPRAKEHPFPTSGPVSCVGSELTRMSAHQSHTKYCWGHSSIRLS